MTLSDELDDAYQGDDIYDPEAEPLDMSDAEQVDRALWRVGRIEADTDEVRRLAARRIDQVNDWKASRIEILDRERLWWLRSIEGWTRAILSGQKTQTVNLPSGKLSLRKRVPAIDFNRNPDDTTPDALVKVTRSWAVAMVRKAVTAGPELETAEGITWHQAVIGGEVVVDVMVGIYHDPGFSHRVAER